MKAGLFSKHFSTFLAFRYLKPERSAVSSIITLISICGVALGVTVLVIVIAVFSGYEKRLTDTVLAFEPHLVVDAGGILDDWDEVQERVETLPDVESTTPFVQGQVLMDFAGRRYATVIRAIDPPPSEEPGSMLSQLENLLAKDEEGKPMGKFLLDFGTAVIGDDLANSMGIHLGDYITVHSPKNIEEIYSAVERAKETGDNSILDDITEMSAPKEYEVVGMFNSDNYLFDSNYIFIYLASGQELYSLRGAAHGLAVNTPDGLKASKTQKEVEALIGPHYQVRTWMDMHRDLFSAVATERSMMYLILFIIMIVAGFCIMNTLFTVTFEKRGEIGLMKAVGATEEQIAAVFILHAAVVAVVGILSGLGFAFLIIARRNDIAGFFGKVMNVEFFKSEIYQVEGGLPADPRLSDISIISLGAFVACVLAALAPAIMASLRDPAKALRSE